MLEVWRKKRLHDIFKMSDKVIKETYNQLSQELKLEEQYKEDDKGLGDCIMSEALNGTQNQDGIGIEGYIGSDSDDDMDSGDRGKKKKKRDSGDVDTVF